MKINLLNKLLGREKNENPQIRTLAEAKKHLNSYVTIWGDWGRELYLLSPTFNIKCSEDDLKNLSYTLEKQNFGISEPESVQLKYEIIRPYSSYDYMNEEVIVNGKVWIHPDLNHIKEDVYKVLQAV